MLGSTLTLFAGITCLAGVRLSGNPAALGLVVFIGLTLVAAGCAMHLSVLLGRVGLPNPWRPALQAVAWIALAAGAAWVVERAPGDELVIALMTVPSLVGAAGLLAYRTDRWPSIAFFVLSVGLTALLAPVWLAPNPD